MASSTGTHTEIAILCELGLSQNEAILYTYLLGRPRCTVRELGTGAPFPRTMLYHVLNQLMRRELVTAKSAQRKTVYIAENPERLYDILSHRERELKQGADAVRRLVPRLKHRYHLATTRTNVRIFEGIEEYQKALEDQVRTLPKEILSYEVISSHKPGLETRERHNRERIARKIPAKVLFFSGSDSLRALARREYDDFTQYRSIKQGTIEPFAVDISLYDGKLLYTSYDEYEPTATLIEDKALYDMQRNLFMALWKHGTDQTLSFITKK